ncbi:MAG: hypothetical protein Cons2KO_25670 [Congregibacter sp.]
MTDTPSSDSSGDSSSDSPPTDSPSAATPVKVTRDILRGWLGEARLESSDCGECDGFHLAALREQEGVIDSRVFVERYGLLLTTELEIRPMALLSLSADVGRLNMDYPTLKVFLDVVDDATPQLVMASVLPSQAGLNLKQTASFLSVNIDATRQLCEECLKLDYLFARAPAGSDAGGADASRALH